MSSVKEDHRGSQIDSSQEADGAFIIAGGERTILFQFSEEVFNQMARLIEVLVIGAGLEPIRSGRNNTGHLRPLQNVEDAFLGIIGCIREQGMDTLHQIREKHIRAGEIRGLAGRETKADRIAQGITGRMEFGTQAPAGAAEAFRRLIPPFAPAAC